MTPLAQVSAFLALYSLTLIFDISFYRIVDLSMHVYCSLSFCFPPADAAHPNAWRRFWIKKNFPLVVLFFRKCLNAHAELSFLVVSIVVKCHLRLGSTNRASWRNYVPSALEIYYYHLEAVYHAFPYTYYIKMDIIWHTGSDHWSLKAGNEERWRQFRWSLGLRSLEAG